jgi:hypothetical protein
MSLTSSTSSNVPDKTDGTGGSIPRTKTRAILNKWGNTSAIPNTQRQSITSNSKSSLLTGKLSRLTNSSMGDASAISARASKTILQRMRNMRHTRSDKRTTLKEFVAVPKRSASWSFKAAETAYLARSKIMDLLRCKGSSRLMIRMDLDAIIAVQLSKN